MEKQYRLDRASGFRIVGSRLDRLQTASYLRQANVPDRLAIDFTAEDNAD